MKTAAEFPPIKKELPNLTSYINKNKSKAKKYAISYQLMCNQPYKSGKINKG